MCGVLNETYSEPTSMAQSEGYTAFRRVKVAILNIKKSTQYPSLLKRYTWYTLSRGECAHALSGRMLKAVVRFAS